MITQRNKYIKLKHITKYVTKIKSHHTKRLIFIKLHIAEHKEFRLKEIK